MNNVINYKQNGASVTHSNQLVIFFAVLLVYIWSMPRTVVLEDDGLFILAAYFNGIAHPPGYPLYTLMSHIATWIPIGSVATRVHGFTAVLGALSCVCLYRIVLRLVGGQCYALVGSLALGFSLTFWSQSIIAEVYSLNVLLFLLLLWLALVYGDSHSQARQGILNWMGLLYGLGLCNHWPLVVLSSPVLLVLLWPHRQEIVRQFPRAMVFGLLGLLPYGWMVWRSQMDPLISFYGPITSWQEFWFYVSRQGYAQMDVSPSAGFGDKLAFGGYVLSETLRQFTWLGMGLVLVGFVRQWRQWAWPVSVGLTLGYVGNTFVLIGLLGFDYDFIHRNIFRVYPLVAYGICAIWLALGLKVVIEWVIDRYGAGVRKGLLQGVMGVLVIGITLMSNTADNYRATDTWAEDYARVILDSLDENAVLFTYGDTDIWTIGYVHHVLGLRPDVVLYNIKGNVYSNRLYDPVGLDRDEVKKKIDSFIKQIDVAVYYTYEFPDGYGQIDYGLFKLVLKDEDKSFQQAIITPQVRQYFETILARGEPVDNWEKIHYRLNTAINCLQSVRISRSSSQQQVMAQDLLDWIDRICDTFQGKKQYAEYLLGLDYNDNEVWGLIADAESHKDQVFAKPELGQLEYYKGELFRKNNDMINAKIMYTRSLQLWPHPGNNSKIRLEEMDAGSD